MVQTGPLWRKTPISRAFLQGRQCIKNRFICWVKCTRYFWTIHVLLRLIIPFVFGLQCAAHETLLTRKLFQRSVKSPFTTNTLLWICLLNGCDWRFFIFVTVKPAGWGGVAYKETFSLPFSHRDASSSHNVSIRQSSFHVYTIIPQISQTSSFVAPHNFLKMPSLSLSLTTSFP
jgi:hypothetical protein